MLRTPMSGDFLAQMAHSSRERVARARALCAEALLRQQALGLPPLPQLALSARGFDVIAEVKLRSPALGRLNAAAGCEPERGNPARGNPKRKAGAASGRDSIETEIQARVRSYADAGAALVSVLTEPSRFDGALSHVTLAVQALGARVPVMRKDFLVDPYQVYEARVAGAGGVLLILRMLDPVQQAAMIDAAAELGVFVLLEAFDEADLERAGELVARYRQARLLVGVNCRDLGTLEVVPDRLMSLAPYLPRGVPCVAESGVQHGADAAALVGVGYDLALVGGALMRSAAPAELITMLLIAGRAVGEQRARCGA
jgi:indole-3-glycerol phosphate synthase